VFALLDVDFDWLNVVCFVVPLLLRLCSGTLGCCWFGCFWLFGVGLLFALLLGRLGCLGWTLVWVGLGWLIWLVGLVACSGPVPIAPPPRCSFALLLVVC